MPSTLIRKPTGPFGKFLSLILVPKVTSVPCGGITCGYLGTEIGITSTPVIDVQTGTLYVCAFTLESGNLTYRLHALDLGTGAEKFGGPVVIQGSVGGTGDASDGTNIAFDPHFHLQRSALLLANGVAYIAFASFADGRPYHGWVFGYDARTLQQRAVLNLTPNGDSAGIWQSGAGLASDSAGNLYVVTGNGTFDAEGQDFGESFLKLMPGASRLSVIDSFTPFNYADLNARDADLGSGGPLLLPDQSGGHPHLMLAGGKDGTVYLVDRDNMGHFRPGDNSQIVQYLPNIVGPLYSTPVYWENKVYFAGSEDSLTVFTLNESLLSTAPASHATNVIGYLGATPAISANGSRDGIVWLLENALFRVQLPAILRAYDASDVSHELYNSEQAGTRDTLPIGVGYGVPTVANGKVYVGTLSELAVFGLMP
jgi:hypothetical protein